MKLEDYVGEIVDVILINGNYYPEVELVAVDMDMGGIFIRDSPMYKTSNPDPYFVSSIAEIRRLFLEEEIKDLREKAVSKNFKAKKEESVVQVWPVRKSKGT